MQKYFVHTFFFVAFFHLFIIHIEKMVPPFPHKIDLTLTLRYR